MNKYEKVIYDYFNNKSKESVCVRFQDTLDASKKSGLFSKNSPRLIPMERNPSDFMITDNGDTYYAEVKHTENTTYITSSLLSEQKMFRDRILKAGGKYIYYIYADNIHQWYAIPGQVFKDRSNVKWKELGQYMINYLKTLR